MQSRPVKIAISEIKSRAAFRPRGYYDDVVGAGEVANGVVTLSACAYASLVKKYTVPQARATWPAWANAIAKLRKDEDRGVGDTVHRLIGEANSERFKRWHLKLFKATCGCQRRHAEWNALYPYAEEATSRHSGRLGGM